MIAVDFGDTDKQRWHGDYGPIEPPSPPRGTLPHHKFVRKLEWALHQDDVVTESATVGSSGCEPAMVADMLSGVPNTLYTISTRAAKNWWRDFYPEEANADRAGEAEHWNDERAAAIIWEISTKNPAALKPWRLLTDDERVRRVNTSVRPYDKRKYMDPAVERYMAYLPPYSALSEALREVFCTRTGEDFGWSDNNIKDYRVALTLPFAMALADEDVTTRDKWERVLGLYAHGYPSFYRRAAVAELTKRISKQQTGKDHKRDITREERKTALKHGRWCLRQLYYLSRGTRHPEMGTIDPEKAENHWERGTVHPAMGTFDPAPMSPTLFDNDAA